MTFYNTFFVCVFSRLLNAILCVFTLTVPKFLVKVFHIFSVPCFRGERCFDKLRFTIRLSSFTETANALSSLWTKIATGQTIPLAGCKASEKFQRSLWLMVSFAVCKGPASYDSRQLSSRLEQLILHSSTNTQTQETLQVSNCKLWMVWFPFGYMQFFYLLVRFRCAPWL